MWRDEPPQPVGNMHFWIQDAKACTKPVAQDTKCTSVYTHICTRPDLSVHPAGAVLMLQG
eukprot:6237439-Pyramimonas_sp.AAC.1